MLVSRKPYTFSHKASTKALDGPRERQLRSPHRMDAWVAGVLKFCEVQGYLIAAPMAGSTMNWFAKWWTSRRRFASHVGCMLDEVCTIRVVP